MNEKIAVEWNDNLPLELNLAAKNFRQWNKENNTKYSLSTSVQNFMYHYTNAAGLKGIIENECFWFTDYRYLNDTSEINYGMSLFSTDNIKYPNKFDIEKLNGIIRKIHMSYKTYNFDNLSGIYIASYTSMRDDINQWKMYGDDGRGFVIRFSKEYFKTEEEKVKIAYLKFRANHLLQIEKAKLI